MSVLFFDEPALAAYDAVAEDKPRLVPVRHNSSFELSTRVFVIQPKYRREMLALRDHDLLGKVSPSSALASYGPLLPIVDQRTKCGSRSFGRLMLSLK